MKIDYINDYSPTLGRYMELKVYGHGGRPIIVFPSQGGRFYEYEGFGMVDSVSWFLEHGKAQLFCVDGLDWETFTAYGWPGDRLYRHEQYMNYICNEVVPWALDVNQMGSGGYRAGGVMGAGCSMGALHAANFFFRRPDVFDGMLAQSGLYSVRSFFGDSDDQGIYFNSPMEFLPNLNDEGILNMYRRGDIIFSVGQGAWEQECLADTRRMDEILHSKGIPAWFDYWGYDVPHDWPSWRNQLPYFFSKIL